MCTFLKCGILGKSLNTSTEGIKTVTPTEYHQLKKTVLERYFQRTNDMQKQAIFQTQGPVLIIAGAGSGKTTVLCNRTANLILFGDAYHSDYIPELSLSDISFLRHYANGQVENTIENTMELSRIIGYKKTAPWRILAVTFTNKAATELKERLEHMGAPAGEVWAFTFHSACIRILRQGIEALGYKPGFAVYDMDDSQRVIKDVMKQLNLSDKVFNPKQLHAQISRAKDQLITPETFSEVSHNGKKDYMLSAVKSVYNEYQKALKAANALDFDDIIMKTVQLFEQEPEILEHWQNRFEYIMVDEYQDTNYAQYRLVSLLAKKRRNLCVVGDEDQSIYRFRGATIENILSFEKEFDAKVIKLEQNYRSTETILAAANKVISNNTQRKSKNLWSDLGKGDKIQILTFSGEREEGMFVANTIDEAVENGAKYADHVILYRTNAQSRTIEQELNRKNIPYTIVGGTRFYERKEIKDMLAYLSVVANPYDEVRFMRIVNEPKRGIGEASQAEIKRIANGLGISYVETLQRADEFPGLSKKSKVLMDLGELFAQLSDYDERDLSQLLEDLLQMTGYADMLKTQGDEGEMRLQNIRELKSAIMDYCEETPDASLEGFLERSALIADIDTYDGTLDRVSLMTMHSSKGLEYDTVFLVGAEENIFPSYRSNADPMDLEEERRLAYVAITRAKRKLYITRSEERLLYGQTMRNPISRFVKEMPSECVEYVNKTTPKSTFTPPPKKPGYLQSVTPIQQAKPVAAVSQTFSRGERITHNIFGPGTVLDATPMGNDTLLEIAFDRVGTKKVMANFAKIKKSEE